MKIFYIGMQRCGTKSFGEFFKKNGYKVCSWQQSAKYHWPSLGYEGRYLDIIQSNEFQSFEVFEDGPFYSPEFVKFIYNYVEDSYFVYFHRPPEDWYKSMISHSHGMTLGNVTRHCYFYNRLHELHFIQDEIGTSVKKLPLVGMKNHYVEQYEIHRHKIRSFFSGTSDNRFFSAPLYSQEKWKQLANAFDLNLAHMEDLHAHKSKKTAKEVICQDRIELL
jgi:hypothetical protein